MKLIYQIFALLQAGLSIKGECLQPLDWEGTFSARLKPLLEPGDWGLRFGVVDSRLYQRSKDEISVARVTWDLVKRPVLFEVEVPEPAAAIPEGAGPTEKGELLAAVYRQRRETALSDLL